MDKRKKVIFIDWHGVISDDIFWSQILNNTKHPYNSQLDKIVGSIFNSSMILRQWMKGNISSLDIIRQFYFSKIQATNDTYWLDELKQSCASPSFSKELVNIMRNLKDEYFIVLATDNMDCFYDKICKNTEFQFLDDILCSSEIGFLKGENPKSFFLPWLDKNNLYISESILIDDRAPNCLAFENIGGSSYIVSDKKDLTQFLKNEFIDHKNLMVRI